MNLPQPELIEAPTAEEVIRQNLEKAMIRYRGDIQAYYSELLKRLPEPPRDAQWVDLQRFATMRLRARR